MASLAGPSIRRLAYVPLPHPGEAMISWVDRLGTGWHLSRLQTCVEVGITRTTRPIPPGLGIMLGEERLRRVVARTGLRPETVKRLTFQAHDGRAVDLSTLDLSSGADAVRVWLQGNWCWQWQSHACVECLRERPGVWQLRWRLPYNFACPAHGGLLADHCSGCGARLHSALLDSRQGEICCAPRNRIPGEAGQDTGRRRRWADVCGSAVADAPARPIDHADQALYLLQDRLDALSRADTPAHVAREYLTVARTVLPLVRYVCDADAVEVATSDVRRAWLGHCRDRDEQRPPGVGSTSGYRAFGRTQAYSALTAASWALAAPVVFSEPGGQRSAAWADLLGRTAATQRARPRLWAELALWWKPPPGHEDDFRRAQEPRAHVIPRVLDGRRRLDLASEAGGALSDRHVPQLIWPEAYEFLRQHLPLSDRRDRNRAAASLALARHLAPERLNTWGDAAVALQVPASRAVTAREFVSSLGRLGLAHRFGQLLDAISAELEAMPSPIDYRARRSVFAAYRIPDHEWSALLAGAEVRPNHGGGSWPVWSSVWVGCLLTGNDWRLEELLQWTRVDVARRQRLHHDYVQEFGRVLPRLEDALREHARELLAQRLGAGPVEQHLHPGVGAATGPAVEGPMPAESNAPSPTLSTVPACCSGDGSLTSNFPDRARACTDGLCGRHGRCVCPLETSP